MRVPAHYSTQLTSVAAVRRRHQPAMHEVSLRNLVRRIVKHHLLFGQPTGAVVLGGQRPLNDRHALVAHDLERLGRIRLGEGETRCQTRRGCCPCLP